MSYNISYPISFLGLTAAMFLVIVFRYFLVAGSFYTVFYLWNPSKWKTRKIHEHTHDRKQFIKEIKWSLLTSMIFALIGSCTALAWQNGYTAVYTEINQRGILYFIFSLFLLMFIHETYYYWMHRLMHHPTFFKQVHKVHHDSIVTSSWTAFSFHPIEGFLEGIILPILLFIIPVHYYGILIYLTIMTISSVINHLNVEVYPKNFESHWLGKWLIGASHHSLHHSQYKTNYGLYFTFWDKLMKTQSGAFDKLFRQKTSI